MTVPSRFGGSAVVVLAVCGAVFAQSSDAISESLQAHQRDLTTGGKAFLLSEASRASFVVVGGLHGDQETPALVQMLAAGSEPPGYQYVAAEMSPWAASRLEAMLNRRSR